MASAQQGREPQISSRPQQSAPARAVSPQQRPQQRRSDARAWHEKECESVRL